MAVLDGATRKRLIAVIGSRVPSYGELGMFLDLELSRRLSDYAAPGPLPQVIYDVLEGARRHGWIDELLEVAARMWPEAAEALAATPMTPSHAPLGGSPAKNRAASNPTPHEPSAELQLHAASPAEGAEVERLYDSPASGGVFISYRRADTAGFAGRLYDRIADRLGRDQTFMDVASIELGVDFVRVLDSKLDLCAAMVVVIGDEWLIDSAGRRRLDDPADFVRLEIEKGLARDIRVIPILVDDAVMPRSDELPPSLASLVRRQGGGMSNAHFDADIVDLLDTLTRITDQR